MSDLLGSCPASVPGLDSYTNGEQRDRQLGEGFLGDPAPLLCRGARPAHSAIRCARGAPTGPDVRSRLRRGRPRAASSPGAGHPSVTAASPGPGRRRGPGSTDECIRPAGSPAVMRCTTLEARPGREAAPDRRRRVAGRSAASGARDRLRPAERALGSALTARPHRARPGSGDRRGAPAGGAGGLGVGAGLPRAGGVHLIGMCRRTARRS